MRVYLSGPMTGVPDLNRPAFAEAADRLRRQGHDVVSPVDNGLADDEPWEEHLRADIRLLLDCDAIAMLDGWYVLPMHDALDVHIARALGIPEVAMPEAATEPDRHLFGDPLCRCGERAGRVSEDTTGSALR